ncbi:hypothetical protein C8Q80DRAFT_486390 [Daedaleopsis nitida]|nr:hypothetical protein C8Q80DRAFT_486390 [Daedaleopsis nitida]
MSTTIPIDYTLISTYEEVKAAVGALAQHKTVILICEGPNLGRVDGVLSIFAIADAAASHVYLFDALPLNDKHHSLLSPLLSLLRNKKVTKLVWDAYIPFLEIAEAYGVLIDGVLDAQLAEIMQRPPHQRDGNARAKHTIIYFKQSQVVSEQITNDPAVLDGVHRIMGLQHCAGISGVTKDIGDPKKHPAIKTKADADRMWLERPLHPALLQQAAREVVTIAHVHSRLQSKTPVHRRVADGAICAASARYMRVYPTRELKELHVSLDLGKFLPLDVLDAPDPSGTRYRCARCERMLSLSCFFTRAVSLDPDGEPVESPDGRGSAVQRMPFCQLCILIARRLAKDSEVALGEWVLLV